MLSFNLWKQYILSLSGLQQILFKSIAMLDISKTKFNQLTKDIQKGKQKIQQLTKILECIGNPNNQQTLTKEFRSAEDLLQYAMKELPQNMTVMKPDGLTHLLIEDNTPQLQKKKNIFPDQGQEIYNTQIRMEELPQNMTDIKFDDDLTNLLIEDNTPQLQKKKNIYAYHGQEIQKIIKDTQHIWQAFRIQEKVEESNFPIIMGKLKQSLYQLKEKKGIDLTFCINQHDKDYESVIKTTIKNYTAEKYKDINGASTSKDIIVLRGIRYLFQILIYNFRNKVVGKPIPKRKKLYRNIVVDKDLFELYKKDSVVCFTNLTSTSIKDLTEFRQKKKVNQYWITYIISLLDQHEQKQNRFFSGLDIAGLSENKHQFEVLVFPFQFFKIVNIVPIKPDHYKIYLKELENKEIIAKMEEPLPKNENVWSLKQNLGKIVNKLQSLKVQTEKQVEQKQKQKLEYSEKINKQLQYSHEYKNYSFVDRKKQKSNQIINKHSEAIGNSISEKQQSRQKQAKCFDSTKKRMTKFDELKLPTIDDDEDQQPSEITPFDYFLDILHKALKLIKKGSLINEFMPTKLYEYSIKWLKNSENTYYIFEIRFQQQIELVKKKIKKRFWEKYRKQKIHLVNFRQTQEKSGVLTIKSTKQFEDIQRIVLEAGVKIEKLWEENPNKYLTFSKEMLDKKGNNYQFEPLEQENGQEIGEIRGGEEYCLPKKCKRVGLNVSQIDNDDEWLSMRKSRGWPVVFTGIGNILTKSGFEGKNNNDNPKSKEAYPKISSKSINCTRDFSLLAKWTDPVIVDGEKILVGFQCRVDPKQLQYSQEDKNYCFVDSEKQNSIRPYGIILKKIQ